MILKVGKVAYVKLMTAQLLYWLSTVKRVSPVYIKF
jgi:hypothetical protein